MYYTFHLVFLLVLFEETISKCNDPSKTNADECSGSFILYENDDISRPIVTKRVWENGNHKAIVTLVSQQPIKLPMTSFCIQLTTVDTDFAASGSLSDEQVLKSVLPYHTKDEFLTKKWNNSFVGIVHSYYETIYYWEQNGMDPYTFHRRTPKVEPISSLKSLTDYLKINDISSRLLRDKLGGELGRLLSLYVKCYLNDDNGQKSQINVNFETSAIMVDQICYRAVFPPFKNLEDFCEIGIHDSPLAQSPFKMPTGARALAVSFTGKRWLDSWLFGPALIGFGVKTTVGKRVEIAWALDAVFKYKSNCSTNPTSFEDCEARCKARMIRELCNCTSVTCGWHYDPSGSAPVCTHDAYVRCSKMYPQGMSDIESRAHQCAKSCLRSCEFHKHSIVYEKDNDDDDIARILIRTTNFEYPVYEEV